MADHIDSYTIANERGTVKATLISIGASLKNLHVMDKNGDERDIVLGFPGSSYYVDKKKPYFGCVVGRVTGRIKDAHFNLDGKDYKLEANNGRNTLHGGETGFSHRSWTLVNQTSNSIKFSLISPNGDSGFPGSLQVFIDYVITESDELILEYKAFLINDGDEKDIEATIVNLTNHSYFNLSGFKDLDNLTVHNHIVQTNCYQVLEKDEGLTANGKVIDVSENHAFDFTKPRKIGDFIDQVGGYDDCFLIPGYEGDGPKGGSKCSKAINVYCPASGISMTMSTTEPAFQFYTANFLNRSIPTKIHSNQSDLQYDKQYGFCLEAQRPPNAINIPDWKQHVILRRGQIYQQKTVYSFKNDHE